MQARVRRVLKTYGRTALCLHASVFAATLSGSYAAIRHGLDIERYLAKIPFVDVSSLDPDAGSLMLAYVSTLATGPARGAVTIGATPILARWLARRGLSLAKTTTTMAQGRSREAATAPASSVLAKGQQHAATKGPPAPPPPPPSSSS